jgi:hypothetical protein
MLQMILPSWPFTVWELDILGLFPRAVRGYRYLYVAIDKFTKWLLGFDHRRLTNYNEKEKELR